MLPGLADHLQWMFLACTLLAVAAGVCALVLGAIASRIGASDGALGRLGRWLGAFAIVGLLGQSAIEEWVRITTSLWERYLPGASKVGDDPTDRDEDNKRAPAVDPKRGVLEIRGNARGGDKRHE